MKRIALGALALSDFKRQLLHGVAAARTFFAGREGDTVIGKNHRGGLVTLAERKSRYVLAGHIRSKHADIVTAVTTRLLTPHRDRFRTITFDNGK